MRTESAMKSSDYLNKVNYYLGECGLSYKVEKPTDINNTDAKLIGYSTGLLQVY